MTTSVRAVIWMLSAFTACSILLSAVIALQGLPCGEVVSVKTQGDNDHVATCKNGIRYHVFLNATGRVVVEKQ